MDLREGDRGQERRHVPLEPAGQPIAVDVDIAHTGDEVEHRCVPVEAQFDVSPPTGEERGDVLERHEPAIPDDSHAIADPLHLG